MRTPQRRRLARITEAVNRIPFRPAVLNEAFDFFRMFGELPDDDDRLAQAVLDRATRGGDASAYAYSRVELLVMGVNVDGTAKARQVRDHLFVEAMDGLPFVRKIARLAIEQLVLHGGDVCDKAFGAEKGLPTYGTVGLHVMDMEKRLAKPPYEAQAGRLFQRMEQLRQRLDYTKDGWWDRIRDALLAFLLDGELPEEGIVADWVFALLEHDCLWRHARGEDVGELMAVLDEMAGGVPEGREAALGRVVEFARRGGAICS